MMELLDIRFSYLCRASYSNENGRNPIVLRITFRGERKDLFTGLYCAHKNWDAKKMQVKKYDPDADAVNANLALILKKVNHCFDALRFGGQEFTIGDLADKIRGRENKPTLLIDVLEEGNLKMKKKVGTEILKVTYNKYRRSLNCVKEFLQAEYNVKNFSLQKLDTTFFENYFQYLRSVKGIAHNTACKYLVCVKTILLPMVRSGLIRDPFANLKITPKPVFKEYLTQEEVDRIINLPLKDPDLDRKRDIFLFACYTGLAYTDIYLLDSTHLHKECDGAWYIRKPRQKTGQDSIIPLLPAAVRILTKYSPSGEADGFRWYVSTNQKMNVGLKYIGQRAGITKKLHMHLARHTFATTITLSNGVPIETVSKMLGHASIKQTQHYAKVIPLKIKLDMDKIKDLYK